MPDRSPPRATIRRLARRRPKPLGGVIDVYKCLSCGDTLAVNADAQTFRNPGPLECKKCAGQPDMQARRYYSTAVASSAPAVFDLPEPEDLVA